MKTLSESLVCSLNEASDDMSMLNMIANNDPATYEELASVILQNNKRADVSLELIELYNYMLDMTGGRTLMRKEKFRLADRFSNDDEITVDYVNAVKSFVKDPKSSKSDVNDLKFSFGQ